MKIRDILMGKEPKYRTVTTVGPNENISMAIQKMVDFDRGAISVCNEKGELLGIITERDIVRKCFTRVAALDKVRVKDIMTAEVAIGHPEDDVSSAIDVMKSKRFRHLPIVEERRVVGMVSMRDLLGLEIEEIEAQVRYACLSCGSNRIKRQRLV